MTAKKPLLAADSGIHLSPQSEEADDVVSSRSPEMSAFAKDSLDQNDLNQSAFANTSPPSPRLFTQPLSTSSPLAIHELDTSNMEDWSVHTTKQWLEREGFSDIANILCGEHMIDGRVLMSMNEEDLLLPILNLKVFGDVRRLSSLLGNVRAMNGASPTSPKWTRHRPYDRGLSREQRLNLHSLKYGKAKPPKELQQLLSGGDSPKYSDNKPTQPEHEASPAQTKHKDRHRSASRLSSGSDVAAEYDVSKRINRSKDLKVDYRKMFAAMIYAQVVLWLTSYTMVVVHDRVPDVEKYPPLPDLVLDNVPYIPWAFQAVETIGMGMMLLLIGILIFHKHRTIIWRRCCALTGTVFLLRCITMLITSLSVPGAHLKCDPSQYPETWMRLHRAFVIWSGFGMTLQGVRTCGDYMFSGHTTVITMLNMFITEYTPSRWYPLHTATWVANFFGVFFILAAHEHYSIDVFVAFFISSRLFLYYHSLANTSPMQKDRRTRIWFPLFSYFEANVNGDIPNEYEFPLSLSHIKNMISSFGTKSEETSDPGPGSDDSRKKKE